MCLWWLLRLDRLLLLRLLRNLLVLRNLLLLRLLELLRLRLRHNYRWLSSWQVLQQRIDTRERVFDTLLWPSLLWRNGSLGRLRLQTFR